MTRIKQALVLAVALAGCAVEPAGEAITVDVEIAPVVEDHPWVIAFLTELGSTRPAGVSARLEGRSAPDGRYYGEPIFEAETRETLAELLAAHEAGHPRPPELAPVWEHAPLGPDGPNWRLHFVDRGVDRSPGAAHSPGVARSPEVDRSLGFEVDSNARVILEPRGSLVLLRFGASQRERFAAFTGAHVGHRIAFTIDDEALTVPTIRSPIPGGQVQLSPSPGDDPKLAAQALVERLTAP